MSSSNITYHKTPVGPKAERPYSDTISPRAVVRPRRRRRLLRPRPRQPRPAPADRRALPQRARLSRRRSSTARILPGAAVSIARRQPLLRVAGAGGWRRATGRSDVCALPYGINTVSLFALRLPGHAAGEARGAGSRAPPIRRGSRGSAGSSRASLAASSSSAARSSPSGSAARRRARRCSRRWPASRSASSPRLSLPHVRARRWSALMTLGIVLLTYFGRVRFQGALPGGAGGASRSARCSPGLTGIAPVGAAPPPAAARSSCRCRWSAISSRLDAGGYLLPVPRPVILPMGLFNVLGSLQNIESAEAAGDAYPTSAVADGERHRLGRGRAVRLVLPDHDLHRPSGLEGARRARRLLGAERRRSSTAVCARRARSRGSPGRCRSRRAWRSCCGSAS